MTDLSMKKEKKKKSFWLLIASPSLLSIKQTNIHIRKHLLGWERYRNSAPVYQIRRRIAMLRSVYSRRMLPSKHTAFVIFAEVS